MMSRPNSPQWDDNPSQIQLSLHLLGILINPHMWQLPDDPALTDDKRIVFIHRLKIELGQAIDGELPPVEDDEELELSPFREFVERLYIPD